MLRQFPLHIHISTLFILLILAVGGLISGVSYSISRHIIETEATEQMARVNRQTQIELERLIAPAEVTLNLIRYHDLGGARNLDERLQGLPLMTDALQRSPALSALYVGDATGDFFLVRRIQDEAERQRFHASAAARFVVQSIERHQGVGKPVGTYLFYDERLTLLNRENHPEYGPQYDPRQRGWFISAQQAAGKPIKTEPYRFFSNQRLGMTLAVTSRQGQAIWGADILLNTLNDNLRAQKITAHTQIALSSYQGRVLAYSDSEARLVARPDAKGVLQLPNLEQMGIPILAQLAPQVRESRSSSEPVRSLLQDAEVWKTSVTQIPLEGHLPLYLVIAAPEQELLANAIAIRHAAILITCLVILLSLPVTWWMARGISKSLRHLALEADAIRHFEFAPSADAHSMISEVQHLGAAMSTMKRTIRRFLDISHTVAAAEDFDQLLSKLLGETIDAAEADAGILYLADGSILRPAVCMDHAGTALELVLPEISIGQSGPLLEQAMHTAKSCAAPLGGSDIDALGVAQLVVQAKAVHAVAVPLQNRRHDLVGAILILRRQASDAALLSFVEALSDSAAISLETRELIQAQKLLFESFIRMIAGAIDAKSPYTGGHCARVPELTKMLAQAACTAQTGPFADFSLDESAWEAVHVAAWLHDCGKVTTPEFVVDKATRLETIYDRIHEIRMRFEVLKRDAEIECLRAIAAGTPVAQAQVTLQAQWRELDDDFAFVAHCNDGDEFVSPEKCERLRQIARRTWLRTLDDRLGLSHEEKMRKERAPAAPLPVLEPLLADKPEHQFERRAQERFTEDNPWGFRVTPPALLYDQGELHNLTVPHGSLNDEERYKINEHIIQTEIMLSQLPFPKHLRTVPELAGGHHEKMDGSGYPKRRTGDQMSPVARMMAIADIFEALTAGDRPYKKGKMLSEALKIMVSMKENHHIDPELFDLFVQSGVYREYATRFMKPEQIDPVQWVDGQLVVS